MQDLVSHLLGDWNVYSAQTRNTHQRALQGRPTGSRKATSANVKLLTAYIEWCGVRHIEPRLFLYFLFARRKWHFAPKFEAGNLMSDAMAEKYKQDGPRRGTLGFFKRRLRASSLEQAEAEAYDPNRDTTPSVEGLKARLQESGQSERCKAETVVVTMGFHPKSAVCLRCPVRVDCMLELESMVPFPIMALRQGRITAQQAEAIATGVRA